jgi:DNA-binding PadR family transcriptional regulator
MSSTRLLVLGVVRIFQPVHGYDVRRELLSWRADQWANVAPGSVYNALKSMARDGLLQVVGTNQIGGRPERTSYRLTPEGENEFHDLLRGTLWKVLPPIDPLMPGLCFFPVMRGEELVAALKHRVKQIQGQLEQMEYSVSELPNAATPGHVKELYRLVAARAAAEIPWAEELIKRVERGEYAGLPSGPPADRKTIAARAAGADVARRAPGAAGSDKTGGGRKPRGLGATGAPKKPARRA